ncbi:hypothetical protein [Myceligenerans indicum]|uniref:Uncharacterized protein n=1 Tax=Myceligenerans indicum TaxID=2593663 RepID=A0ABS1LJE4_9MICO|nr:hypothetical protein [Myceligenerans indicum]MBL0886361.1 hypothetical protein [Myceligenerans indicum]
MNTAVDRDDLYGFECDFLALDQTGSIALISSAGYGPIPWLVLNDGLSVEAAVAGIQALPVIGTPLDLRGEDRSDDYSDSFEMSRRGFYAYDWHDSRGPYMQVSAPSIALREDGVAPEIARAAGLLRLPIQFAETVQLSLDEHGVYPGQH